MEPHPRGQTPPPRLELSNVEKSFGATRALAGVSFGVEPGEVHVLAGENGAGKSTLIKILSGVIDDWSGQIRLDGRVVRFSNPRQAARAGIATIHQELSLVGSLSVRDNLLLTQRGRPWSRVPKRANREHARRVCASMGLELDVDTPVEALPLAERQLLEIARALSEDARVLILDEPTSALSDPEVARLFEHVIRLRDAGTTVLFISHRMEEVYRIADRITVLRDGAHVLTMPAGELPPEALVSAMVGRELAGPAARSRAASEKGRLSVSQLVLDSKDPEGVSFELAAGEVLGVAGLAGSRSSGLLHAVYGSATATSGQLTLNGAAYRPGSPRAAIARGVVLVPSDRQESVVSTRSVVDNATLSRQTNKNTFGFVHPERDYRDVESMARQVSLRAPSLHATASQLSGGNQQKLALMRCLACEPQLLLLDDPTRGIDVGARSEIHELIRRLADDGVSVLMFSSDLDELIAVCDRVLSLRRGHIAAELSGTELDRSRLLSSLMGAA